MYIDERHFVKTTLQKMDFLEQVWSEPHENTRSRRAEQSATALDTIKSTAVSVQARGVYRAAILCEDVLSRLTLENETRMISALVELKRLINLYADGLFEIDPEFAETLKQGETGASDIYITKAHAKAVQTLKPLAQNVDDTGLRQALKVLMHPISLDSAFDADQKSMSLDALIQPVSNLVLSEARHCGKIVTVSYAADFDALEFDLAKTLQDALEASCLTILRHGIPGPSPTSVGATPQISLTGQMRAGQLLFSISWMGAEIKLTGDDQLEFRTQLLKLKQMGGTFSINNLSLSDNLKSRHTLYIKLPIDIRGAINPKNIPKNAGGEMEVSGYA